jgi:hypothetical protein
MGFFSIAVIVFVGILVIFILTEFICRWFQADLKKLEVIRSYVFSSLLVIAGYGFVFWSLIEYPSFVNTKDKAVWFQRSGAAFICIILYAEYFINAASNGADAINYEVLPSIWRRVIHFFFVGVAMIIATLIWGYGDLFYPSLVS